MLNVIFVLRIHTTTSIGNNSVFRSFFEKQKLTGPNFIDLYRKLRLLLSVEDEENYLQHHIHVAPVAPPGQQVPPEALIVHDTWVKGKKEVAVIMLLTMDQEIQRNLAHLGAYDMLQELKAMYSKQAEHKLLQTVREFYTSKQEEGQSVSLYVLKMKGYIKNLEQLDQPVGQNLALHEEMLPKKDVNLALHAIRAGRVQKNQKNKLHKAGKGSHGKCKGKMANASNNVSFASKPKTTPPPKKDYTAKDAICHQCGKVRHWRRNCPGLWGRKKLKPGALSLGVISVSHLFDDGFINRFDDNNVISVSKNNLVYFMAVPPDGIYEIDMSCSNTNDSSIPSENKVFIARNAEFFKSKLLDLKANIRAIRILISIAAYYDYEIWKIDVKTAFLNGHLFEEVYMEQPEGFVNPKYPNHVCKLKRSIYGLKQASRQWNKRFDDEIEKFDVKSYLGRSFAMKDLGEAAYILGIKIYRDSLGLGNMMWERDRAHGGVNGNVTVRVRRRMDLLRAVIIGAEGTQYHDGLFFFDVCFLRTYP
nr:zinc finger, CCHC-type [Tanacetum cinerariifolium]